MSEKFSLKWNDFQSNISKTFGSVRTEEYLCDVTLVSDDSRQVSAHKLVLSACSEYFKDIFRKNQKHNHLLLCLDGITSNDLTNVLDYIYNGHILDILGMHRRIFKRKGYRKVESYYYTPLNKNSNNI